MQISIVIALVSLAWSAGIFVGLFTSKFVGKKSCEDGRRNLQTEFRGRDDKLWERVDALQDVLTAGGHTFEIRLVPKKSTNG